ncbi:hypothetical protein [Thermoactinomyces sp. DSM 45892]|uniref:hypothetical protein n=1 Tax=Thermoactinomyces sp. DSM 45892 TaxID=1882753 RepID=UPI00089788F1|nr:hypothetical protein [Thermoactinomyces sp. DSM 45892]SDX94963.1 hypothetical protein SAMN05444416_10182 [Thermoactinomyces sp. DSM 45892]
MKIILPNGEVVELDQHLNIHEKKEIVEKLKCEWIDTITKDKYAWFNNNTKYFLDSLANYLVWHKDNIDKCKHDKEVLSKKRVDKLSNFRKDSKEIPFSNLPKEQQQDLGIEV